MLFSGPLIERLIERYFPSFFSLYAADLYGPFDETAFDKTAFDETAFDEKRILACIEHEFYPLLS